jgi:putative nucleotidyltransferase with HDIG domain
MNNCINQTSNISFNEISDHLLYDITPSAYFNSLSYELRLYPLNMLCKLKKVEQSPKHHPEGNVWNHTMMVVDEAAKVKNQSSDSRIFMWAALLHDIGKPDTTKIRKGRITSYDHDIVGAVLARKFLNFYNMDSEFIDRVSNMVRYHMHMLYILKGLPFANPTGMTKETNTKDLALLCRCDRLGRIGADIELEYKNYEEFLKIIKNL